MRAIYQLNHFHSLCQFPFDKGELAQDVGLLAWDIGLLSMEFRL